MLPFVTRFALPFSLVRVGITPNIQLRYTASRHPTPNIEWLAGRSIMGCSVFDV